MTEIYPPDLEDKGLGEAIRDLGNVFHLGPDPLRLEVDEPLNPHPMS